MAISVSGGGKRRIVAAAVAHERLGAAMRHYRRLERDWQAWIRQHPISVDARLSALTLEADLVALVPEPVDQSLTEPAKACLGEVRAALDNMVVALVADAGGDTKARTRASFPITEEEEDWPGASRARLSELSDEVRA